MKKIIKKALRPGKIIFTAGLAVFLILLSTQKVSAAKSDYPYLIMVNRYFNTITVYAKDETGAYNDPVKAIVCSVGRKGTETKLGTYQTKGKYRWKSLMGDVWGQYSTRIVGGILFHSVYYYEYGNPASLASREYNKLGDAASHGCIRLTVEDAKWIFDNCPVGTTVIIYDDAKSPGPLGKPEAIKLPSTVRWDPTDPSGNNPFKNKKPIIYGVKNQTIPWGSEINLREGISAKSSVGLDITKNVIVNGSINKYKAGSYKITYTVTDALGRTSKKTTEVTVEESPSSPVFEGISGHVVRSGSEITRAYALSGVKVRCGHILLDKNEIQVTFTKLDESKYQVFYTYDLGGEVTTTASSYITIDGEAPVISGVTDRTLLPGQMPDITYALTGVTVSDNYSKLNQKDIKVTIEEQSGYDNDSSAASEQESTGSTDTSDITQDGADNSNPSTDIIIDTNQETQNPQNQNDNINNGSIDEQQNAGSDENESIEKSFLVTYKASDEAGNTAKMTAVFRY